MTEELPDAAAGKRLIAEVRLQRYEAQIERAIKRALRIQQELAMGQLKSMVAAIPDPLNELGWYDLATNEMSSVIDHVTSEVAEGVGRKLGIVPTVQMALDTAAMSARILAVVTAMGPELAERLGAELTLGVNAGESIPELRQRVNGVFDYGRNRAHVIARTETHHVVESACNEGAMAIHNSGEPLAKTWLATKDSRTRKSHRTADGQTVAADQPFKVDGEEIDYPGEGSAKNSVNCRCSQTYGLLSEAELSDNTMTWGSTKTGAKVQMAPGTTQADLDAFEKWAK